MIIIRQESIFGIYSRSTPLHEVLRAAHFPRPRSSGYTVVTYQVVPTLRQVTKVPALLESALLLCGLTAADKFTDKAAVKGIIPARRLFNLDSHSIKSS
jgi:hypothetical protein